MKILQSKPAIALFCFALGAATLFLAQKTLTLRTERTLSSVARSDFDQDRLLDTFFNDDFWGKSHDPFEEMRRMRARMAKQLGKDTAGGGIFDSWYQKRFGGGSAGAVQKREDDKFVYYDISIDGLDKDKLNVKVGDGQVTISGRQEKKTEEGSTGSYFSSTFHRSFPVPRDVDGSRVQMESAGDKLVVKFPKVG